LYAIFLFLKDIYMFLKFLSAGGVACPLVVFVMMFISLLFAVGVAGVLCNKKNIIKLMACIEILFVAASLQFAFSSLFLESVIGQVYAIVILAVGASEVAVGLGLIISAHRTSGYIAFQFYNCLKG
jgi:NADH-quinone oxidoreductase subunit K